MASQVSVAELQEFFFEAASATFASGLEPIDLELGQKYYQYERDELVYTDEFFTNGEYSAGQTRIYLGESAVWVMQYQGWCKDNDPEVIAFLQRALMEAYSQKKFRLGRGPQDYREADPFSVMGRQSKPLTYGNYSEPSMTEAGFEFFQGHEVIFRYWEEQLTLFRHRFQGMLLRDKDDRKQPWLRYHR